MTRFLTLRNVLSLALALAIAFGLWQRHRANAYHDTLIAERAVYVAAQKEAGERQRAANLAAEASYKAKAEEADHVYQVARVDADRRTERFIGSGGVRTQAVGCPSRRSDQAANGDSAQSGNGPGETPVVAVTADDVRICSENTTRLEAVRDWALGLGK